MGKKLWFGVIVVFIGMAILGYIVHGVLLTSAYQTEPYHSIMRPESEMWDMMWIFYVIYIIQAFFFTFIFLKGYEGKGIMEGVRYGFYMGMLMATPMAYASYVTYPMPYSLAFQWFIYAMIEYILLGVALAVVVGKRAPIN